MRHVLMTAAGICLALPALAQTAAATFQTQALTPETALIAAQGAMTA